MRSGWRKRTPGGGGASVLCRASCQSGDAPSAHRRAADGDPTNLEIAGTSAHADDRADLWGKGGHCRSEEETVGGAHW